MFSTFFSFYRSASKFNTLCIIIITTFYTLNEPSLFQTSFSFSIFSTNNQSYQSRTQKPSNRDLMAVSEQECSSAKSSPSSSSSSTSRYYLSKCVVRASAILQVLYAHLRSPSSNDVVFGKVFLYSPFSHFYSVSFAILEPKPY